MSNLIKDAINCIAENFRERTLSRIGGKCDFHGENFHGLLAHTVKGCYAPKFYGENFANSLNTSKFVKVISLESFLVYGI